MLPELMKKITQLKDLRDAIRLVRSSTEAKKTEGTVSTVIPPGDILKSSSDDGQQAESKEAGGLRHLGIKSTTAGVKTHVIGIRGANAPHYEVDVHMHNFLDKRPSMAIHLRAPDGSKLKSSPTLYDNIHNAIKAVVSHHNSGKWE